MQTIKYISCPEGTYVFPTESRQAKMAAKFPKTAEIQKQLESKYKDSVSTLEYNLSVYSTRDELDSKRVAKEWYKDPLTQDNIYKLDDDILQYELLVRSVTFPDAKTQAEVRDKLDSLHPALYRELANRLNESVYMSPDMLDFTPGQHTNSGEGEASLPPN